MGKSVCSGAGVCTTLATWDLNVYTSIGGTSGTTGTRAVYMEDNDEEYIPGRKRFSYTTPSSVRT